MFSAEHTLTLGCYTAHTKKRFGATRQNNIRHPAHKQDWRIFLYTLKQHPKAHTTNNKVRQDLITALPQKVFTNNVFFIESNDNLRLKQPKKASTNNVLKKKSVLTTKITEKRLQFKKKDIPFHSQFRNGYADISKNGALVQ